MRKTSVALASIVGAVTCFFAPETAGLAKGLSRSASLGAFVNAGTAACEPTPAFLTHMGLQLILRHGVAIGANDPHFGAPELRSAGSKLRTAAKLMGVVVPMCINAENGFLTKVNVANKVTSWASGPTLWWALATQNSNDMRRILRISSPPGADIVPGRGLNDCPKTWLETSCPRRELGVSCLIAQMGILSRLVKDAIEAGAASDAGVRNAKIDADTEAEKVGCYVSKQNDCSVRVLKLDTNNNVMIKYNANEAELPDATWQPLMSAEQCGGDEGSIAKVLHGHKDLLENIARV